MAEEISVVMGIVDQITKESKTIAENLKREVASIAKVEAQRNKAAADAALEAARRKAAAAQDGTRAERIAAQEAVRIARQEATEKRRILAEIERAEKQAAAQEEARMRQRLQMQRNSIVLAERQAKEAEANRPKGFIESVRGGFVSGSGMGGGVAGFAAMGAAAAGAAVGINALTSALRGSIDAANEMNKAERALKFATGDARLAAEEMAFLRAESNRLGVAFTPVVAQYARLAASAQGTKVSNEDLRKTFTAISQASVVLGMSSDEVAGSFRALGQIMSKGTVQAEEIRGQLGDRLVGSVQAAARAMGGSMAEFNKQLEQGQIISDEFIPKFIKAMDEGYRGHAVDASKEARAEIQRLHNEFSVGGAKAGEATIQTYGAIARVINSIGSESQRAAIEAHELRKMSVIDPENYRKLMAEKDVKERLKKLNEEYGASGEFQSKAEAFRIAETEKARKAYQEQRILDEKDSAKSLLEIEKELATAKALAGKEGYERERAQANLDLERNLEAAKGFQETELAARNLHKQRMIDIARAEGKEAEEARQEAAYQAGEAARARQRREAEGRLRNQQANAKADADEAKARAEKMQAAARRFEDVNASGDPLAQLRLSQARELALYAEGSEARKTIQKAHIKEMDDAQAKHTKDMADAWLDLASTMSGALQSVAGDNGFTRIINRTLEVVGVLMALQRQMQAIQAMSGVTAGAGAIGLSAAMPWVGAGIAALSLGSMLFREDGGPVYGRRHSQGGVPMVAEEGELVWSRKNVARVGGMANAEAMRQGGGMGGVYAPQVTVGGMQITVQGDMTPQATARVEQLGNDYIRKVEKAVEQLVLNRSPGMMRAFGNMRLA